jgi:MFS family permease
VAVYYSLVVFVGMTGSMIASGVLIDRFTKRSRTAYAVIPATSLICAVPVFIAFLSAPGWSGACWFLCLTMFFNYFYLSSTVTLVQQEVRPDQRVMSGALLLLVMNFLGLGLGPTYVGAASDFLRAYSPEHSLHWALYTCLVFYVVAIAIFLMLARVLRRESRQSGESVQC